MRNVGAVWLALAVGTLLATPHAAAADRTVCVVSLSTSMAEQWERLLEGYGLDARAFAVTKTEAAHVARCGALVVTSDTAFVWSARPESVQMLKGHSTFVIGAAVAPVLEAVFPEVARSSETVDASCASVRPTDAMQPWLTTPHEVTPEGAGGLVVCRERERFVGLAPPRGRSRSLVKPYATRNDDVVLFSVADFTFWGLSATPDGLTADGRTVFANAVHAALPPAPVRAERPAPTRTAREPDVPEPAAGPVGPLVAASSAERAPDLDFVRRARGAPGSIRGLRGQPSLVVFWATWCGPCKRSLPRIDALHERIERDGIRLVAVSVDDDGDGALAYMDSQGYDLPVAVAGPGANRKFGLHGIPSVALLDSRGRLRGTYSGGNLESSGALGAARRLAEE